MAVLLYMHIQAQAHISTSHSLAHCTFSLFFFHMTSFSWFGWRMPYRPTKHIQRYSIWTISFHFVAVRFILLCFCTFHIWHLVGSTLCFVRFHSVFSIWLIYTRFPLLCWILFCYLLCGGVHFRFVSYIKREWERDWEWMNEWMSRLIWHMVACMCMTCVWDVWMTHGMKWKRRRRVRQRQKVDDLWQGVGWWTPSSTQSLKAFSSPWWMPSQCEYYSTAHEFSPPFDITQKHNTAQRTFRLIHAMYELCEH